MKSTRMTLSGFIYQLIEIKFILIKVIMIFSSIILIIMVVVEKACGL